MSQGRHDPVQRLNDHHADDLLAVAQAFGDHPDATSARVQHLGPAGIDLVVGTPSGPVALHVEFTPPVEGTRRRLRIAFAALVRQARATLEAGGNGSGGR